MNHSANFDILEAVIIDCIAKLKLIITSKYQTWPFST